MCNHLNVKRMKKIVILALSAIFVANISAQEMKNEKCDGMKFNKEERVELDIRRFTNELMLSDQQAEKFAVTYREYSAKMDELFKKNKVFNRQQGKVLTDAELDQKAKQRFESFKDLADLQSKYYDENLFHKEEWYDYVLEAYAEHTNNNSSTEKNMDNNNENLDVLENNSVLINSNRKESNSKNNNTTENTDDDSKDSNVLNKKSVSNDNNDKENNTKNSNTEESTSNDEDSDVSDKKSIKAKNKKKKNNKKRHKRKKSINKNIDKDDENNNEENEKESKQINESDDK